MVKNWYKYKNSVELNLHLTTRVSTPYTTVNYSTPNKSTFPFYSRCVCCSCRRDRGLWNFGSQE